MTDALRAGLTGLDVVLLAAATVLVLSGLRTGLLARLATWSGVLIGLALSGRTVPLAADLAGGAGLPARTFVAVLTFGLTVSLTTSVLRLASAPLRRLLTLGPLSLVDRALGAVASLVAFALLAWLLLPSAAAVPGRVSSEVRASSVLSALDAATPAPPDIARTLRTLLGGERFPDVFASLAPTPDVPVPPQEVPLDDDVLAVAIGGTTGVRSSGCGRSYAGSGFAVDPDHVVTNAHVIAGARAIDLHTHDGRRLEATVVVLDVRRDLALLRAPGHDLVPFELVDAGVGDHAAVVGYPGGRATPRVAAALIERRLSGVGRDIYGRDVTERAIHLLAAELRTGDSGAPVLDAGGRVVGVVFAVSPDVRTVAYALDVTEIRAVLAAERTPRDAGRCI